MLTIKILIIEDNDGDYDYICELLNDVADFPVTVIRGQSLLEAEKLSLEKKPDLILLDLGLPDSFGIETLESVVKLLPYMPIIVLTGHQSEEIGLNAIKEGAQDYLNKNDLTTKYLKKSIIYSLERKKYIEEFKETQQRISYLLDYNSDGVCIIDSKFIVKEINSVFIKLFNIKEDKAIDHKITDLLIDMPKAGFAEKLKYVIKSGNRQLFDYNFKEEDNIWYEIRLDPYPNGVIIFSRDISSNVEEEKTLNELNESLKKSTDSTIGLLAGIIELKEPYTAGHQERVSHLCGLISDKLKIPKQQKDAVTFAARIYDIGKTAIPAEILAKPTALSVNEMSLVKYHVESGYNLVKKMDTDLNLADIIMQHHERIDGSGYPNGITGSEMLIESKILAIADVVDAMLSHRPYRSAFSIDEIINELEDNAGILYDKEISKACIDILKSNKLKV